MTRDALRRPRLPRGGSRMIRRQQACVTGVLTRLTDVPGHEIWSAMAGLPDLERMRVYALALQLLEDVRATHTDHLRRVLAAESEQRAA